MNDKKFTPSNYRNPDMPMRSIFNHEVPKDVLTEVRKAHPFKSTGWVGSIEARYTSTPATTATKP